MDPERRPLKETEVRNHRRVKLAAMFLDEEFIPMIEQALQVEQEVTLEQVLERVASFQSDHAGLGSDFDLDHVWGAAWKRSVYIEHLADTDRPLPPDSAMMIKAWEVLTNLELQRFPDSESNK